MHTLLFDIDGTLLFSGGAGKIAMESTLQKLFGECREVSIPVHGRTDQAIIRDLLVAHEVQSCPESIEQFYSVYQKRLPLAMKECQGYLLAGVQNLIEHLAELPDVAMGLLTGNGEQAAKTKLAHFELDSFFQFGGFGERHSHRVDIARDALTAAANFTGTAPSPSSTWVIGDTIHDVSCARDTELKSLAVGTGKVDLEELKASGPDRYLDDLSDADAFLAAIGFE